MLQFFDSIAEYLESVWDLVVNFFSSLYTALEVVEAAILFPPMLISFVPPIIGSAIVIVVSVGVVKLIVGWGNK